MTDITAREVAKLFAQFIDATLRKGSEQDGNWGWPRYHDEVREIESRLRQIASSAEDTP